MKIVTIKMSDEDFSNMIDASEEDGVLMVALNAAGVYREDEYWDFEVIDVADEPQLFGNVQTSS